MDKILTADFSSGKDRVTVRGLWQFDRGVKLKVIGINVADVNRVDFAPVIASEAVPVVVTPDEDGTFTVSIPGAATKSPYDVTAYIYVDTADYGYTVKAVNMPVILRPEAGKPGEEKPDPFGEVVEKVSGYAKKAQDSARVAAESEKAASEYATQAEKAKEASRESAEKTAESKEAAATSATAAAESESRSRESATAARSAADQAAKSATAAAESATTATQQAANAAQSATNAARSAESAKTAADAASKSGSAAQQAAGSASESASTATAVAQTATTAAGNAAESVTLANQSAETAGQKATAAETSASNAAESATAAGDSASAAKVSETAATASAVTATEQAEKIKASAEQIEKNKTDVTSLKEDTAALQKRQNVLVGSETGNPISCDDAFSAPLCGLHIYGKSTQDGTPSPDNPVPIISAGDGGSVAVRVTGKNMLNPALFQDNKYQSFNVNSNYYEITNSDSYWITGFQPCLPNTTYRFNMSIEGGCFYDKKKNIIGVAGFGFSLKTPVKCAYYCINFSTPYGTPVIATVSESTAYSPYCEQLLTIQTPNGLPGIPVTSGGNYTDPQGQQWVCDEVDLERGVKVQRVKTMVFSDSSGFAEEPTDNGIRFNHTGRELKKTDVMTPDSSAFCSALALCKSGGTWSTPNVFSINIKLYVRFENINSLGELQQYLQQTPMSLTAILANPIETPLTPAELTAYKALTTYAPNTVVQATDGAGLKLNYQRDVSIVIKNLEYAIASMTTT